MLGTSQTSAFSWRNGGEPNILFGGKHVLRRAFVVRCQSSLDTDHK